MADEHTTSPELWDKLRQIRWEHLADLPTEVADVMLEAADFVEVAMSQPQSTSTSLPDALVEKAQVLVDEGQRCGRLYVTDLLVADLAAILAMKSKEQSND